LKWHNESILTRFSKNKQAKISTLIIKNIFGEVVIPCVSEQSQSNAITSTSIFRKC